jgi:hypothetical protein
MALPGVHLIFHDLEFFPICSYFDSCLRNIYGGYSPKYASTQA